MSWRVFLEVGPHAEVGCGTQACLHAEAFRLPARSRFGEGRARKRGFLRRRVNSARSANLALVSQYPPAPLGAGEPRSAGGQMDSDENG